MKIVFASNNRGKIAELQAMGNEFNWKIIPQADLGVNDIAETGLTFVENAILKARHACTATGLPAIADDSGLEVDSLQGAPGIYSARYAGEKATAKENIEKLLTSLQTIPDPLRQANFHCSLVFLRHTKDPTPLICEGKWYGSILTQPRGEHGFGYDPIFYDPRYQCSAAELPLNIKNQISHRGQALAILAKKLTEKPNLR